MEIGKISNEDLHRVVFDKLTDRREEVKQSSGIGVDTAVLNFGGDNIVLSTDPITGASKGLGKLAVNISANDVATEGAEPVGILITVLMPPTATIEDFEEISKEVQEECKVLNMELIGGHSEVTDAVNRIVLSSTVIGRRKNYPKVEPKEGDYLCVTKKIAVEGTHILFNERCDELKKVLNEEDIIEIKSMADKLSVVREGLISKECGASVLHDITEGGVYGGVWEIAKRIGMGIKVYKDAIPVYKSTEKICKLLKLDPMRLISSGSMLVLISHDKYEGLKSELEKENILLTKIGVVKGKDVLLQETGEIISPPDKDELYRGLVINPDTH